MMGRDHEAVESEASGQQQQQRTTMDADFSYWDLSSGAILSSLPILLQRLVADSKDLAVAGGQKLWKFVLPSSIFSGKQQSYAEQLPATMKHLLQSASNSAATPVEFMLRHFDTNGDGHISAAELLNMTEILKQHMPASQLSWGTWLQREWPLLDWKIGVFLWSTFGGILFLLAGFSVIPGRIHGFSAKVLRWPVLAVVNFLIVVELMCVACNFIIVECIGFVICERILNSRHITFLRQGLHCDSTLHSHHRNFGCTTETP